jgi:predicted phosphoribosyltransferase
VAPTDTLKALQHETDVIVCLEQPSDFGALGFYYDDFRQVSDREVVAELANHKAI